MRVYHLIKNFINSNNEKSEFNSDSNANSKETDKVEDYDQPFKRAPPLILKK